MRPVVLAEPEAVVIVVVDLAEAFCALNILPEPAREGVLDGLLDVHGAVGSVDVKAPGAVGKLLVDPGLPQVQSHLDKGCAGEMEGRPFG